MAVPAVAIPQFTYVDSLFEKVCVGLQLTQTQFEDAKQKYGAIGRWLADPTSPLYRYSPDIYPQGSMLIGTTIRPWRGEEFDLDVVCELRGCDFYGPLHVYNSVEARLRDHATYQSILEPKNRCLRLNYAGDFHLDVIPACPGGGGNSLKVPDRALEAWITSSPKEYADWFFKRCQYRALTLKGVALDARIQPLPNNVPSEQKYPLQRAVQLLKRHRDSFFGGPTDAARSILLTTLAASTYEGQESVTLALDGIVSRIWLFVSNSFGIPTVLNPVNPQENLAAGWNAETYPQFLRYVQSLRHLLNRLIGENGIDTKTESLGKLVGKSLAESAVRSDAQETEGLRNARSLRVDPFTGFLGTVGGIAVPRNNFYGA